MPDGFVEWAIAMFVITTLAWAAVWWWLPALFGNRKDDDREG
jgi:hypothetical protein